jgi:histidyl-tRNA synthetase
MKAAMRQADKSGALFTLILGSEELANNTVMIKNMHTGEQRLALQSEALNILTKDIFKD